MTAPEKKSVRRWTLTCPGDDFRWAAEPVGVIPRVETYQRVEVVPAADYDAERRTAEEWEKSALLWRRQASDDAIKLAAAEKQIGELEVELMGASAALCDQEFYKQAMHEAEAGERKMRDLLQRIHDWDHMDTAGDGPYWRMEIRTALNQLTDAPIEDKYLIVTLRARDGEQVYTRTTRCYEWKEWKPFMAGSTAEKMFEELLAALDQPATTEEK
jgi:hypothetical protein